jgi:hypothetical protein
MMTRLLIFICLMSAVLTAQSPDFSNKNDVLNGRRTLLRVSDVSVVSWPLQFELPNPFQPPVPKPGQVGAYSYLSNNGVISGQATYKFLPPIQVDPQTEFDSSTMVSGRMWDLPADTFAYMNVWPVGPDPTHLSYRVYIGVKGGVVAQADALPSPFGVERGNYSLTGVDVTGDGFQDLLVAGSQQVAILTAQNPQQPSSSTQPYALRVGPPATVGDFNQITTGDLDGDGLPEIVGLRIGGGGVISLQILHVDPKSLVITAAPPIALNATASTDSQWNAFMTIGQFSTDGLHQIALAFLGTNLRTTIKIYKADSQLNLTEISSFDTGKTTDSDSVIKLCAGRLTASSPNDSLVAMLSSAWGPTLNSSLRIQPPTDPQFVEVYSVDTDSFQLSQKFEINLQNNLLYDIAIGNFDLTSPDPLHPGQTQVSNLSQIGILYSKLGANGLDMYFRPISFNADWTVAAANDIQLPDFASLGSPSGTFKLVPNDIQGRSLQLGNPVKVELNNNVQTSVVSAAPPVQVDFITPANGTAPIVLNISALSGFRTSYDTSQKQTNQTSTTNGSSWTFGAKETGSIGVSIGDVAAGDGAEIKESVSAAQNLKGQTDNENGSYSSLGFDVSASTATGDTIWFTSNRLNLWIYDILGQKVCPASNPNCTEKSQATITFSAPDQVETESIGQDSTSLYQPPWEYGNLFSYPANYEQIQQIVPDLAPLTTPNQSFSTSGGQLTLSYNWSSGSSTGTKSGFEQNYSFGSDLSAQGAVGIPEIATVSTGYEIDLSGSYGLSNLTTNLTQMDTSTGLSVQRPEGFLDTANYGYTASPYIFGRTRPATVDDASKVPTTPVSSFGALRSAFTVDINSSGSGGFWRQAYGTKPDIGLGHRSRWKVTESALQDPPPQNCRPSGLNNSQQDCFDVYPHTPKNPWLSPSLFLQGFFVSNAEPNQDPTKLGTGPNLTTTSAGTKLNLQVRVYNFSFAQLPAGTNVHVQFYGMPWDISQNIPTGPSFKIGTLDPTTGQPADVIINPIPPLTDSPVLNWTLATTTFDTTSYANQNIVFWVVVWAQTGNSTLVSEIGGHGLTRVPNNVMADMSEVPVEMNASADKTTLVTYSNNLGMYQQVFYVSAPAIITGIPSSVDGASPAGRARIGRVDINARQMLPRESVEVAVAVRAQDGPVSKGMVRLYDGHPDEGGKLIAVEHLVYIPAGRKREVKLLYRPANPGLRRIWAFVDRGQQTESSRASRVLCVGKSCREGNRNQRNSSASDDTPDPRERP